MKTTDFALYLNKYFLVYLPSVTGCTPLTIDSYRYTFILFLTFMEKQKGIRADKVKISDLNCTSVSNFLEWLQVERSNSISTRNQRQAAIKSFVRFLMYEFPEYLTEYQRILGIPVKKAPQKEISFLKTDGLKLFLSQVNTQTSNGLRDYVMLTILYTTGIRVSELIHIRIKDISLQEPYMLLIHGKGQKSRYVPLMKNIIPTLNKYLIQMGYDKDNKLNDWLFINHMKDQFTRQGVNYIVKKYTIKSREIDQTLVPANFSPHKMRHTTAMDLLNSGVDLIYIRDLLGHVSVKTTEVYAKTDAAKKRKAIEAASRTIVPEEKSQWVNNTNLKDWLKNFNRK